MIDSLSLPLAGIMDRFYGLYPIDWFLLGIYILATIGLGVYYSRQQTTSSEYFLGSGKMNPFFIGVSLFATLLSTITYLSSPGEAIGKGPVWACGLLMAPVIYFIVAYGLLPVYMKQRVTSAYELLEERLGVSIRLLGATMFLALRLVWMTLLIYIAGKAMVQMMGVPHSWTIGVVFITGTVAIIYTSLGGLRTVVVTDCMQTVLMLGGALLVIGMVTYDVGGFSWFPTTWQPTWDTQPVFPSSPTTRVTMVTTMLRSSPGTSARWGEIKLPFSDLWLRRTSPPPDGHWPRS